MSDAFNKAAREANDENRLDFGESRATDRRVGTAAFKASDLKVKQNFDNECTVMIWRTSKAWAGLGGLNHPGHASVLLRKSRNEGPFLSYNARGWGKYDDSKARYVSFWPGSIADKTKGAGNYTSSRDGDFLHHHNMDFVRELGERGAGRLDEGSARRQGQIMVYYDFIKTRGKVRENTGDVDEGYGQRPDILISLQAMAPNQTTSLGLQINNIVDWCRDFRTSPDFNYKYISSSNNCAGVAVRALSAGGAEAFAAVGGCSSKSSIYFTPSDAEDWANSVAAGIQKVNAWLSKLNRYAVKVSGWDYDWPTVAEWKKESHKSFSFRGSETRGVDDALAVWQACKQGQDPKSFPKAFGALVQIIQHTFMHMQKDPNSGRSLAYRKLARHILDEVEHLAQIANRPWKKDDYYGSDHYRPEAKKT